MTTLNAPSPQSSPRRGEVIIRIPLSLEGEGQGEGEIEIDGNSHDKENAYEKDRERQREIKGLGIQFLRFNDLEVKRNMPGVLSVIEQWIEGHTPGPSQEGN